jgi:hypothetical protein
MFFLSGEGVSRELEGLAVRADYHWGGAGGGDGGILGRDEGGYGRHSYVMTLTCVYVFRWRSKDRRRVVLSRSEGS